MQENSIDIVYDMKMEDNKEYHFSLGFGNLFEVDLDQIRIYFYEFPINKSQIELKEGVLNFSYANLLKRNQLVIQITKLTNSLQKDIE